MDMSIATQLQSLLQSDDYEDWLQAWQLIRDHMPASVTTFDELDEIYDLDFHDCSISDVLYDLDEELSNSGLDDLSHIEKRVELSRWVYSSFQDETEGCVPDVDLLNSTLLI